MPIKHTRDRSPHSHPHSSSLLNFITYIYTLTTSNISPLNLPTSLSCTTLLPYFHHYSFTTFSPLLFYRRQRIITDPKVKQMITIRDTLMEYDLMMAMCSIGKIISLTHSYPLLILPHYLRSLYKIPTLMEYGIIILVYTLVYTPF